MSTTPQQDVSQHVSFWKTAWDNKATGWHLSKLNPALQQFGEDFFGTDTQSILFPLCGKTLDMTILAEKYKVAGIEGVELALQEYAQENDSKLTPVPTSDISCYQKYTVTLEKSCNEVKPVVDLYLGDFFEFKPEDSTVQFDRVFDRGSLVAIKPNMRQPYVKIIDSLLKRGGKWMIASMEYDQNVYPGPPHSIGEKDCQDVMDYLRKETGSEYKMDVVAKVDAKSTPLLTHSRFLKENGGPMDTYIDYVIVLTKQ